MENKDVRAIIQEDKNEEELYSKYKQYCGYVFYIGKKYDYVSRNH